MRYVPVTSGVQVNSALQGFDSFGQTLKIVQGYTQVIVGLNEIRDEPDALPEGINSLLQFSLAVIGVTKVEPGVAVLLIQF